MDIAGKWFHHNEVSIGGGLMVIDSKWLFTVAGEALLEVTTTLRHGDQVVNNKETRHEGKWNPDGDAIVVTIPGHSDSPFKLRFVSENEIRSQKRGVWQRSG